MSDSEDYSKPTIEKIATIEEITGQNTPTPIPTPTPTPES
jgi:hypothetical protein